ncbi:MAG: hypothetical protein RIC80_15845 [Cyclobacteriaceae bacterium]
MRLVLNLLVLITICLDVKGQATSNDSIYESVISKSLQKRHNSLKHSQVLLISDLTVSLAENSWVLEDFDYLYFSEEIDQLLLDKFKELLGHAIVDSTTNHVSLGDLNTKFRTQIISQGELDDFFIESPEDGWKSFYKKYRNSLGLIRVSSIYYNKDIAIVYVTHHFGELGATGDIYFLQRKIDTWVIISETNVFKS